MVESLLNREKKIAVIGLGYVGLPIALAFAKKMDVIGFDINAQRIEQMKQGIDPSHELTKADFQHTSIHFTTKEKDLAAASFFVVAVPTPIDKHNTPDLRALKSAVQIVAGALKKGDYVVFESTVYPGCTEDVCLPILEDLAKMKLNTDFKIGFSPERINPGDKEHTLTRIIKVVSGSDEEALHTIADVYGSIITAGIHKASSIKVAEAAKVIENTQRDLNIALMNELSKIFNKMDISTYEVLAAASTKWNFLKFYPGLVGGHCIGVDPYYLTFKALEVGYNPEVILSGRRVNDSMPDYVAGEVAKKVIEHGKSIKTANVLVKGITFKENVTDIRNSKAAELVLALNKYFPDVDVEDPFADAAEVKSEYGITLKSNISKKYDVIIFAVAHNAFLSNDPLNGQLQSDALVFDLKNMFKGTVLNKTCWTL